MDKQVSLKEGYSRFLFGFALIVFFYWLIAALRVNVYAFTVTGMIFEIIWLPFLLLVALLPLLSLIQWVIERFRIRSTAFYAFMVSLATIVLFVCMTLFAPKRSHEKPRTAPGTARSR